MKAKGFSLIELLIVVAIILIIAAIAIPTLRRSRMAANESAAAATVRTLNTTEVLYSTTYPTAGFATLSVLGPGAASCGTSTSVHACLADFTLGCSSATCTKNAYKYTITVNSSGADYVIGAIPTGTTSGGKDFCSIPDAIVRFQADASAGNSAPATDGSCAGGSYN